MPPYPKGGGIILWWRPLTVFDSTRWRHDQTAARHWRYESPCCQVRGTRSWVAQCSRWQTHLSYSLPVRRWCPAGTVPCCDSPRKKNSQRCWHQSLPSDKLKLSILTAIFPGGPGFNVFILDFIGATGDGGGGDNWSYKTCKAPVKSSPPKNKHTTFNRPDALPVAQPTLSKHWRKNITFHGLVHPELTWGSSNFVSDH